MAVFKATQGHLINLNIGFDHIRPKPNPQKPQNLGYLNTILVVTKKNIILVASKPYLLPTLVPSYQLPSLTVTVKNSAKTTCRKRMSKPEISTSAPDRISSLPDDTLIHILSSLPAKKAFATRILSKRWIHLCCCVLDLDLSDVNWEDRDHFVYSVLQLRKAAGIHSINSFIMDNGRYSPRLRDIVVGSWEKVTPELPTSILASTTLVVLKLGTFNMRADFHLNMIRLPSLKTLHLKHIMFKHVEDLALILEKCPVLEDLELHSITSEGIYCHKSSEKKLRKLNRADITMCCCYIPMKALSNLKFLRIQLTKVCLIIRNECISFKKNIVIHLYLFWRIWPYFLILCFLK